MDDEFEAGLLRIVDDALSSPPTTDTFRYFRRTCPSFFSDGSHKATAQVDHLLTGRDLLDFPPEYSAALDEWLPRERRGPIIDLIERIGWTVWNGPELTKRDRADGYESVGEFFEFLKTWRARYRTAFGR